MANYFLLRLRTPQILEAAVVDDKRVGTQVFPVWNPRGKTHVRDILTRFGWPAHARIPWNELHAHYCSEDPRGMQYVNARHVGYVAMPESIAAVKPDAQAIPG
jgi:hypothetical protein